VIASALLFFAVALGVWAIAAIFEADPASARLRRLAGNDPEEESTSSGFESMGRALSRIGERVARNPNSRLRQRLVEGGFRRRGAVASFLGLQLLLALGLPVLLAAIPGFSQLGFARVLAALAAACGLGFAIPGYLLDKRRAQRRLAIDHGLPDALDLMVVCVEAGLGLTASLARVARESACSHPVLAAEFELVNLECRAGKRTTDALRAMSERNDVGDLRSLVAMLVQTERFGTSLAGSLRVHADSMRIKRMQRAEEAAQRAPLKMLFPAALLIFPATLMVTIGPGLLTLFSFFASNGS
jgi:tight adherence protein C